MVILGLDPGIARTGFGVIDTKRPASTRCGCLTTSQSLSEEERLATLGADLRALIKETRPELAVVERVYFGTNKKTAIATAQARGVLLFVLRQHHIPAQHLTPLQIKSRLTGYGAADKHQVQMAIKQRLNLDSIPQPDDAADALAAALCATPISQRLQTP